jgi:hypothetical protein
MAGAWITSGPGIRTAVAWNTSTGGMRPTTSRIGTRMRGGWTEPAVSASTPPGATCGGATSEVACPVRAASALVP